MVIFLIIIHVIICLALVVVVLMQTGKGGLDSNFGGLAANTFGTQNAGTFIKNATKILFAAFVISCLLLATQVKKVSSRTPKSRLSDELNREAQRNQNPDAVLDLDMSGFENTGDGEQGSPIEINID